MYLQNLINGQFVQFGFFAVHLYLPQNISRWCALFLNLLSTICSIFFDVCSGLFVFTIPSLFVTLCTCVSTGIYGSLYSSDSITLAVFSPTHGSFVSCSKVLGILLLFLDFDNIVDRL